MSKFVPQFVLLALYVFGLGITAAKHGKPKTGNESFPVHAVATAIAVGLLYWGGFFAGMVR